MIKRIEYNKKLLAILIESTSILEREKLEFPTPQQNSLQFGIMKYSKGKIILPHIHKPIKREILDTQEVIHIESGKVKVDLFDDNKKIVQTEILIGGDTIILISGGHGFAILENTIMTEVKQGPYSGVDDDKTHF